MSRLPITSRRDLLAMAGGVLACASLPPASAAPLPAIRTLAFHGLHTGERVSATYFADGRYLADGLAAIDRVLRDHRTGEVFPIDRELLDLLHALQGALATSAPFELISGYRAPATNASLAQRGGGVVRNSLHMDGMAVDVRLPGVRLTALRDAAIALKGGGVGFYPRDGFVHVDIGRVRRW